MSLNAAFKSIFCTDMALISDDEPEIQSLIDVNNATRSMSLRRLGEHDTQTDSVMAQALSPRRLGQ